MMNILIFILASFFSQTYSFNISTKLEKTILSDYEFKKNQPIEIDIPNGELHCLRTNGTIDSSTFSLVPKLQNLSFSSSQIYKIDEGALCAKTSLKSFEIGALSKFPKLNKKNFENCDLQVVKLNKANFETGFLDDMTNLTKVIFTGIIFEKYDKVYFGSAKNLEEIEFDSCEITDFGENSFSGTPNLKKLIVRKVSKLKQFGVLKSLNNLQEFHIISRKSEELKIDENLFNGLKNLKKIKINFVNLKQLTKEYFRNLTELEDLDLSFCEINSIEVDTFENLTSLNTLKLNMNRLSDLTPGLFKNLQKLKVLEINGNEFKTLNFGSIENLEELSINSNRIKTVDVGSLKKNCPKLKTLWIDSNPMTCLYKKQLVKEMVPITTVASFDPGYSGSPC